MIRQIIESIISFLKSRILPMVIIFGILFILLINRLFSLQIVNGASYVQNVSKSIQKNTAVPATRGRIFDRNGVLLAYNQLAYSVKISDSGTYKNTKIKNASINESINKALDIIKKNGDKINNDFQIVLDENGDYQFNSSLSDTSRLKLLRDLYSVKTINDLKEEQKNATAQQVIDYLCSDKVYGVSSDYTRENTLEIINLRRYMAANAYNRYMTFTIAYEVSDKTVAAILENSAELTGITVEQEYVRRYVDSMYTSNILGYTGIVSSNEIAENSDYEANDVVGKAGIEQSLDADLRGTKGSKTVYVDTVGRITQVLDQTDPVTGNDVYLTIDINLQKKIYNEIENKLVDILIPRIIQGDDAIRLKSDGSNDIYIPIKDVYFALIDNNIISLSQLARGTSDEERTVFSTFQNRMSEVIPQIDYELTNTPTSQSKLSDEMKEYESYIETMLLNNKIINNDNIDKNDDTYKNWYDGNISIQEYLTYAISKNWIDMSKLTTEQYSSLQEAYASLRNYIINKIQVDNGFYKKIYKYMIKSGAVNGRQICLMLFDQGILARNDADYAAISSGRISTFDFMISKIQSKEITPAQLALKPCSGSAVMTDPRTGDVLALVSYPGYDNNKLSGKIDADYYNKINTDLSTPMYDKATYAQNAPGSIFKPISAITALEEGIITPSDTIYCGGSFTLVSPPPKCWLYNGGHGNENVTNAIKDSCDVFFYDVGYRLAMEPGGKYNSLKGTSIMQKYAEELGLATKTNIEISEKEPQASNTNSIQSAIGQGNHLYSTVNMARYVSTLATSGVCHNLTLVDKVTDGDGELIRDNSAAVASTVNFSASTWNAVHSGMRLMIQGKAYFNTIPMAIAGKSGTAQENLKEPDHTTFISYAPYDNPTVALAVVIQNGYASDNVGQLSAEIYKIYLGLK